MRLELVRVPAPRVVEATGPTSASVTPPSAAAPVATFAPVAGPQGPPGPPGASGAGYVHAQVDPLPAWTIAHNLGFRPAVQVTDLTGSVVDGEIVHLSANEVRCLFAIAIAGTARLV